MKYARWSILASFLLAAAWLLAFGPRPAESRPRDRVTVRYWEKWGGHEEDQMRIIVDDFNRTVGAQKAIHVEYLSMSNVAQKTLVATAAGVPPDIAGLWDGQVAQWAAIGALEPLDAIAATYGITSETYKPVYWEACKYQGTLYALISTPASILLHYNKDLFAARADALRAAGCDPTRAPRTLAELDRYADALTERDASGRIKVAGYVPAEPGWYKLQTPIWFGARLYDDTTGKLQFDTPECVRAFEWWQGYSRKLGKDAMSDFRAGFGNFSSAQNPFLAGKVAMVQQGPWMANYIQLNKPEWNNPEVRGLDPQSSESKAKTDAYFKLPPARRREMASWGVAPFPSVYSDASREGDLVDKGVAFCGFDILAIPKGAAHPKEAFEFIAYVNRIEVMEKLCSMHCKNTPLRRTSSDWLARHPNPYIDLFDRMASSPRAVAMPPVPTWPEVDAEMSAAIDRITLMLQDPAPAMRQVQARAQASLDQFSRHETLRLKKAQPETGGRP